VRDTVAIHDVSISLFVVNCRRGGVIISRGADSALEKGA
jgi:hypothetical protein